MKKLLSYISFLILFFNFSINSPGNSLNRGQALKEEIRPLPKGVSIYQLDNGIQVLLIEKPALPMVGVNVIVKVGSAYETFATSGMSHMLEHLLFNGTVSMNQKDLYDAVDKIGGYNNAHTNNYYTDYMMVTPSDKIYKGMEIQAAMLFESVLPPEKFEKEKGIVMEEIAKSFADSKEQAERNIVSIIYQGHALSLPTLGTYQTIKNMNREDVYKFYKNYYRPNNMLMTVIGNFNKNEMLNKVNEYYGSIPPGEVKLPDYMGLATGFEKQKIDLNFSGKEFHRSYKGEQLMVSLLYELPDKLSHEFSALLGKSLGLSKDTLLSIIEERFPKAVEQINFQIRFNPVKNYIEATLKVVKEEDLSSIINLFKSELKNQDLMLPSEIIDADIIKAKTDFYMNLEKPHMFGIYNADIIAQEGIESVLKSYSGDRYLMAAEMLKSFQINSDPVIVVQHPDKSGEELAKIGEIQTKLFITGENKPSLIVRQNNNSDLLAVHYLIKNKAALESKYGKNASKIWHDAFGQRMRLPEVQKECTAYGFRFTVNDNPHIPMDDIYLSPAFGYIRVEALAEDISGAIDYLNSQMLNFIPTKEEYEKAVKDFQNISMMKQENKAKQLFEKSYKDIIYEEEKYPEPESEVTYDNLLKFGYEYFNPQNMIISVVSPGELDSVNKYFAGYYREKNPAPINESASTRSFSSIAEPKTVQDSVGSQQAYIFYGYIIPVEDKDKIALQALSLLLSDKIIFDIREKQGMAYRMNAGIEVINGKALFSINMGTRPENVDKLITQFPGFFTTDYVASFTEEDLEKSVNMYLGRMMFRRLSSINQAYYLGYSYYFEGDTNADMDELNNMKNLTYQDVQNVAAKYLKVTNPVEIIIK